MKYLIISLFFLLPFAIQCNEDQPLLQTKQNTIENLRSLMYNSANYNFTINCIFAVLFFSGSIYALSENQPLTPWLLASFTKIGIAFTQFIFLKKTENIINQSSLPPA